MLNALTKKTEWAPSTLIVRPGPLPGTEPGAGSLKLNWDFSKLGSLWRILQLVVFVALVGAALAGLLDEPNTVKVGDSSFKVKIANDQQELETGLSKTPSLAQGEGMIFVFSSPSYWPIWMKDMSYPIDIVWLDENKNVISVDRNVAPSTYPDMFMPQDPASYVLEVSAGAASGVKDGDIATFNLQP
jgi:uncharacterized membrane protein (UPF0127 family)